MHVQQARKKRRLLRKPSGSNKLPMNVDEKDDKVTFYALSGSSENSSEDSPVGVQIVDESSLTSLGDSQYLFTPPEDSGCVMVLPWGVSIIGESEEEGEWADQALQSNKLIKTDSAHEDIVTIKVETSDIPNIVAEETMSNFESSFELSSSVKDEECVTGNVVQMKDVVTGLDSVDESCAITSSVLPEKTLCRQFSESIQVIASNEPVDKTVPNASGFMLPEGYIVSDPGQYIQLADSVIDTSLLLRQMGQVVHGEDAPEVTINKITSSVYSLMSQSRDGHEGETFVITTQEDEGEEEIVDSPHSSQVVGETNTKSNGLSSTAADEDPPWPLVLIVNADDMDNS